MMKACSRLRIENIKEKKNTRNMTKKNTEEYFVT